MQRNLSLSDSAVSTPLFQLITYEDIQKSIAVLVRRANNIHEYSSLYYLVGNLFSVIQFILNLGAHTNGNQWAIADNCLKLISDPQVEKHIHRLIREYSPLNQNQGLLPGQLPSISKKYFHLLDHFRKLDIHESLILKLIKSLVLPMKDLAYHDLEELLLLLRKFTNERDTALAVFRIFAEQAERNPTTPLCGFVAKSSPGSNDSAQIVYLEILASFNYYEFSAKTILDLMLLPSKQNKRLTFYANLDSKVSATAKFIDSCEKLRIAVLYKKLNNAELTIKEKYLLADKEAITQYILLLSEEKKQQSIATVIDNLQHPLSKYFWTARNLTEPNINKGELKKLNQARNRNAIRRHEEKPAEEKSVMQTTNKTDTTVRQPSSLPFWGRPSSPNDEEKLLEKISTADSIYNNML